MPTAKITSKGQVTIPKKVRDELHLKPGDKVNFELRDDRTVSLSASKSPADEVFGMLKREKQKPLSVEEMEKGVAEYFEEKYGRDT